jgi:hypothetical protein
MIISGIGYICRSESIAKDEGNTGDWNMRYRRMIQQQTKRENKRSPCDVTA